MSGAPAAAENRDGRVHRGGYLKSTFKHGAIYGLGTLLAKAIGFIMLPIYTRVLTPGDYGILELLSMTTDVIAMITGVGLTWSITRYYYYYDDPVDRGAVISSAAILLVALVGVASAVALPLAGPLAGLILGDREYAFLMRLSIAVLFLSSFLELPLAFLRARQESTHVVAVSIARLVLGLSLNILFVVVLRLGVAGVLYSTIGASAASGAYLLFVTVRDAGVRFSVPIARKLIAYGVPIVAANLGSFVLHYSDRYLLRAYGSLEEVGLYSLAYKFAMLLSLFIATPFAQIWAPKALEIEKAEGERAQPVLRRIITVYNIALISGAFGIALFAGHAIRIVAGEEFHTASQTVPLLCLGLLFFGYRQISYIGASIRERSDVIAAGTIVGATLALAANFALIPRWGATGAALATAVGFATEFAVVLALAERVYPLRYPLARLFAPVALAGVLFGAVHIALPVGAPLTVALPAKIGILGLFVVIAAAGALGPEARSTLIARARRPKHAWARLFEE